MTYPWHLYFMASLYIFAGCFHFIKPKIYLRIMPKYLPNHKLLVYLSGGFEIALGICLCIPVLKNISIYGIVSMLAVFLLVHFNMLTGKKESAGIPKWLLITRIPLQLILMFWAYWYLKF